MGIHSIVCARRPVNLLAFFSSTRAMIDRNLNIDFNAQQLVLALKVEQFVSANVTRDGSCLFRSVSVLVAGDKAKQSH